MDQTVCVYGHFNNLHSGHIRFLSYARSLGAKLFVGVILEQDEDENSETFKIKRDSLLELSTVDVVEPLNGPVQIFLRKHKPNILVKGQEHKFVSVEEEEILKEWGGKLIFSSGLYFGEFSKGNKKGVIYTDSKTSNLLRNFMNRHEISKEGILESVESFQKLNFGIIGDTIIDQYVTCSPVGISGEEPILVATPLETLQFIGGAAIVAAHSGGLGITTSLLSVCGEDNYSQFIEEKLRNSNVTFKIAKDITRDTTVKQRFKLEGRTVFRLNKFSSHVLSQEIQDELYEATIQSLPTWDALIFSDFNYGVLSKEFIRRILYSKEISNWRGIIAMDSQYSSQLGDMTKFPRADLITPTEREARAFQADSTSGLVSLASETLKRTSAKSILMKLGGDGLLIQTISAAGKIITDQLPAINNAPVDLSGAGDSLLVGAVASLVNGDSIFSAGLIGSLMAAAQTSTLGNTALSREILLEAITNCLA